MMKALDPKHESELAQSLMAECERLLDAGSDPESGSDSDFGSGPAQP